MALAGAMALGVFGMSAPAEAKVHVFIGTGIGLYGPGYYVPDYGYDYYDPTWDGPGYGYYDHPRYWRKHKYRKRHGDWRRHGHHHKRHFVR